MSRRRDFKRETFVDHLRGLVNNAKNSDIRFIVGESRDVIYGHRCILSCRCAAFDRLFLDDSGNLDELYLPGVSVDVFLVILEFLYTNQCDMERCQNILMDTMIVASEFGMEDMIEICKDYMKEKASVKNACDFMQIAMAFDMGEIKETILPIFESNFESIVRSNKFVELSQEVLEYVLKSDKLNIEEYDLIVAVSDWAVGNAVVLGRPAVDVVKPVVNLLRICSLSRDDLSKLEAYNNKHTAIPVEAISLGWKSHALNATNRPSNSAKPRMKH